MTVPRIVPAALYFLLVALLSLPIYLLSYATHVELMPGIPLADIAIVVPAAAAALAATIGSGKAGWRELLARIVDRRRPAAPSVLLAVAIPVGVAALSWLYVSLMGFRPVVAIPLWTLPLLAVGFLFAALLEEIGWTALATDDLLARLGPTLTGALVGIVWAAWHFPALLEVGRSPGWIAGWTVWTIASRVVMVQLYVRESRLLWVPVIFHAASNVAWQLAPDAYDPAIEAAAMLLVAVVVCLAARRR